MAYSLTLVTPPAAEPVSVASLKTVLGITDTDQDARLTELITRARVLWESYSARKLLTQTWDLWLDGWPDGEYIEVPAAPLQSVTYVRYYGSDDTEYTMDPADYSARTVSGFRPRIWLKYGKSWPSATLRDYDAVVARLVLGYGSSLPAEAGHHAEAITRIAAYLHYHRGDEAVDVDRYLALQPCPDRLVF